MSKPAGSRWSGSLAWGLAAALLAGLVLTLDTAAIFAALRRADPLFLVTAAAVELLATYWFGTEKYRVLLGLLGSPLSRREAFVLRGGTLPARALLPLRTGELVSMAVLRRSHGVPLLRSGVATVLDLGLEAVVLLALLGLGAGLGAAAWTALALPVVAFTAGAAWWRSRGPDASAEPGSLRGRLHAALGLLGEWAGRPESRRRVAYAFACAAVIVLLEVVLYALVFQSVGLEAPLQRLLLAVPLVTFATGLPATPVGLGAREGAVVVLFLGVAPAETLFAAAVLISLVGRIFPVFVGVALLRAAATRLESRPS